MIRFESALLHPVMYALGWALLHFIWQGAIVSCLLASALFLLRNHAASLRYGVALGAMLLMPVLLVATTSGMYVSSFVQLKLWSMNKLAFLLLWVVSAWLIGVLFLFLKLAFAWTNVRNLKQQSVSSIVAFWEKRLARLCTRMKITRPVCLLESALIQIPTAIGWLRPVILLPASAITGLTPRQLESILAHELAHVQRYDYFFNLLQKVVEILLFYHPTVWWISRRIRIEREHCCDDIAVKVCGDTRTYARALTVLEELRNVLPQLAIDTKSGSLIHRIRHIISSPAMQSKCPAWLAASAFIIPTISILAVTTHFSGVLITAAGKMVNPPIYETAIPEENSSTQIETLCDKSEQLCRLECTNPETVEYNSPKQGKLKKEINQ